MSTLRSFLYWLASLLGDVQAISKGPRAIVARIARKAVLKRVGRGVNRIR